MKVLVTGGAGFIGSHLSRGLIARGEEVTVLVREQHADSVLSQLGNAARVIVGDARDAETVTRAADGCSAIFHCAAMVGADTYARYPVETMTSEIDALRAVCAAALSQPACTVVYPSTSAVYGNQPDPHGVTEDAQISASSSYAISKRYNELFLSAQHTEFALSSVIVRIFNVYGPGQDERLVIPRFIKSAIRGAPLAIYGDGSHMRDFVYIDDVVDAMIGCVNRMDGSGIVNAASGVPVSINDLAATIIRLTGGSSIIEHIPLPTARESIEVALCIGSSEKLKRLTGSAPSVSLEDGLAKTIAGFS